jgi:DNA (cytosine-5)-methyltransferase 1
MLGWRTVCAVECDPYAAGVLLARQNGGTLAAFPVWDDVRTFDGKAWRGRVDVVSGGFPCQDISIAGTGAGLDGARSGLWREYARIVGEVRPRFVCVENSPALTHRGLDRVLADLAALGYDAEWGVLGASDVGAPHRRERIWILAYLPDADRGRRQEQRLAQHARLARARRTEPNGLRARRWRPRPMADADRPGCGEQWQRVAARTADAAIECGSWWRAEPQVGRVAHGVAARVDRLRCLGNGQVPLCVAVAFAQLADRVGLSIGRNTYEFARRKIESENAASLRGERGAAPWATD